MLVAADPIVAEPAVAVSDESELLILDDPPSPKHRRQFRVTRWVVGGGVLIGLFFTLMVPTMCRSSEAANRIKCSSNLRQIGIAATLFAHAHDGMMPANWQELATAGEVTADVFVCPTSNDTDRAIDTKGITWAASLDDAAAHHCSYLYAGNGLRLADLKAEDIIAFEPATDHSEDGVNLLFADGHVDWQSARAASKPAYDRLMADHAAGVRPLRWED